jgi:hypothetical protein
MNTRRLSEIAACDWNSQATQGRHIMLRFHFVTIIPLEFWAIVLLLLFMWAAFGLGGLVITALGLALIMFFGQLGQNRNFHS